MYVILDRFDFITLDRSRNNGMLIEKNHLNGVNYHAQNFSRFASF